jgi:hypothetical protein
MAYSQVSYRCPVLEPHRSKAAGLAMAFKLIQAAERRWRLVNAPHLVALVRAGATFKDGKLVERPEDQEPQANATSPTATDDELAAA